jgi:hypothetical protein
MTKKFKAIVITIITILFVCMAGNYLLDLLFEDMCGNDLVQQIPSPNGEKEAYVFERSCGATTGFSPQLSILYMDDELQNESGNTFRTDKNFSIEWLCDKKLKIIYDKSSETYKMDHQVIGVEIEYISK